jgi:uncharacterized protein YgfB (UPF0149 family)
MQALRILTKRAMRVNLLPNYEAFENQLMNQQVPITPAELQGILMGFYAAGMPLTQSNWLQQVLQLVTNDDALELLLKEPLSGIQQQLKHELIDAQGSLTMLIHNDDAFIVDRAESLVYWSQGFILGFESLSGEKHLRDEEAKEAYSDIKEITQLDLDSIQDNAEDEKLLYSIQDHIKISALLVYHSLTYSEDSPTESIH